MQGFPSDRDDDLGQKRWEGGDTIVIMFGQIQQREH